MDILEAPCGLGIKTLTIRGHITVWPGTSPAHLSPPFPVRSPLLLSNKGHKMTSWRIQDKAHLLGRTELNITHKWEYWDVYSYVSSRDQVSACVCMFNKRRAALVYTPPFQPTPKHFDSHPLWPSTKINITCDPWPQLHHSKAGPPAGWECFGRGGWAVCHANQLA